MSSDETTRKNPGDAGYSITEQVDAMIGRRIASVTFDKAKDLLVFRFEDGHAQAFSTEGGCCSSSWIEHVEMPGDVAGATLLRVDDSATVDATDDDKLNPVRTDDDYGSHREHECLKVYHTRFSTDRGEIVVEFRNSSNGYYGGWLIPAPLPVMP